MGIIYILENKLNGKCYVGKTTKPFNKRFRAHQQSHSIIGSALRKYGVNSFNKTLLDVPEEKLDEIEREYIQKYNSKSPNGYNLTDGGEGLINPTEEVRNKIGEASKGRKVSIEVRKKISESLRGVNTWMKGRTLSEETKKKIGRKKEKNSFFGKRHTEESIQKMSEAHKGKTSHFGFKHTEESKKKMSIAHKNISEETRRKMSESHKK
jgi:group I intron endonuclease